MAKPVYDVAREALATLEFFQTTYSSGEEFQRVHAHVVGVLRAQAQNYNSNIGDKKFLLGLADTLVEANKPGEYVSRQG